jgi:serine phosphatase RsbU (regulator of sigma subunit)
MQNRKPTVVIAHSDRVFAEQLQDLVAKEWPEAHIERFATSELFQRFIEDAIFHTKNLDIFFLDLAYTGIGKDSLLEKIYLRWPKAIRILFLSNDQPEWLPFLKTIKPYSLFLPPYSIELFDPIISQLKHQFLYIQELSAQSQILSELNRVALSLIGETNFEKLLHKLMRILLDNANATAAYIIFKEKNHYYIRAEGTRNEQETRIVKTEVTDFSNVCPAIVAYVETRKENLLLSDAVNEGLFKNHPFIRKNQCRSILCVPLIYQGNLFGLLYLENRNTPNAFSTNQIEFLKLMSAPAAIAIQNVLTYSHLEELVQERTEELEKQKQLLEERNRELAQRNKDILASLQYAQRIQQAYLPSIELLKSSFPDSFVYYRPKEIVSGDFYWFSPRLSKILVAVGDCTGHGIPGAFVTAMANTLLKQIVELEGIFKPDEILYQLHVRMRVILQQHLESEKSRDGLDLVLTQIDIRRKRLLFSGANRPLLIIREGNPIEIKGNKYGIGGTQYEGERTYDLHTVQLQEGDRIYLFSDGFQDQIGAEQGKRFRSTRFYELLSEIATKTAEQQMQLIDAELRQWKGDYEQIDDITIIGIHIQ